MAYLVTKDYMAKRIYQETMDEISRDDDSIIDEAIARAVAEAEGYMGRFDTDKLLGTTDDDPEVEDSQLTGIVADIALWHFIQLGNANIDMARAQAAYEYAVKWLDKVQNGKVEKRKWPYHDTTDDATPITGDEVFMSSNKKRTNHLG